MAESNQTKSTGRGGKRPGAGRKPGSTTKKTREIAEKATAEGVTPLEVMLKVMRGFLERAEQMAQLDPAAGTELLKEAADVAKNAAPYMHPRLAAVEHTGKDGKDLVPAGPVVNLVLKK